MYLWVKDNMRLLFLFLLVSTLSHAQAIRLGQFNKVKVFDGIRLTIIPSDADSLIVEGKNKGFLSHKNKNGKLYLRMDIKKRLGGFNTTVALFSSSPLEEIDANEGAFVSSQDVLFQPSIILKAQEGAEIDALLDVQKVKTKTASGGIVNLKGSAVVQYHSVVTGGVVEAAMLDSEQVEVKVKAGGRAVVNASELAEIKVSFGGTVSVYGKPKKLIKSVAVGGNIEQKNTPSETTEDE
ncbi:MAG: chaperonin [Flavobacteriaceae bacterium]|nr:chaperonin [Flavobacteriaceae bacterium]